MKKQTKAQRERRDRMASQLMSAIVSKHPARDWLKGDEIIASEFNKAYARGAVNMADILIEVLDTPK